MVVKPTLVVLAAGMATRYGSLKQLEKLGPHGETLLEYGIYDAIRSGFGKVILVIRQAIEKEFKAAMGHKFSDKIAVEYVMQELNSLPAGYPVPANRTKPWGTGHAVWLAGTKIKNSFAVINGDDFYGYESLCTMAAFLMQNHTSQIGLIGFRLNQTLSEHGAVSRGICEINENGYLQSITERTHITRKANGIFVQTAGEPDLKLTGDEIVSLNLLGFPKAVLPYFKQNFSDFLSTSANINQAEFYLPAVVADLIKTNVAQVKVLPTAATWFGVTYPADKQQAVATLKSLVAQGVYPEDLWKHDLPNREKDEFR